MKNLYLRIYLTVVLVLLLFALAAGWLFQQNVERERETVQAAWSERAGGWAAFTDGGAAPRWIVAARLVLVLALAATVPTILGVSHGRRLLWTVGIAALPFFWIIAGVTLALTTAAVLSLRRMRL